MEKNYPELFRRRAFRDPDRRALTFDEQTFSYAEVVESFESLAAGLLERGLRPGDRVVYAGLNHPSLIFTMFAVMDLGAVFVPVDPRLAPPEREWVVDDLRPSMLVVSDDVREEFTQSLRNRPETQSVHILSADGTGVESIGALVAGNTPLCRCSPDLDDPAAILYTSGSTGRSKGVVHSHRMILSNAINLARLLGTQRDDVGLVMTPLFHTAGFSTNPPTIWAYGGEIVLLPKMSGQAAIAAIADRGVTRIDTVTAALGVLFATPGFDDTDLSGLRSLNVGGAAIPVDQVNTFREHGTKVYMAAGMTECCTAVALAPELIDEKPTSVGKPLSLNDVRIVSLEDGEEVNVPDSPGELWLRGPAVTRGYWNNPAADAEAFDGDNWFRTGDIARLDADGDMYLVGRVKDVIKTGGESVAAIEVERVIAAHPAVNQVAVVGAPDQRWGETIVAVVSLKPGQDLDLDQVRDHCAGHLARFKLPTRLLITKDLPMTASGKIAKGKVRELAASRRDAP
ncbi:AMP-binding protein [Gordonia sp. ABSL11-1]|uniref:class I adenylate-forming enzyme family protein n=1 Tax=Gordonia sp. ABSL11-1 TaxID=3053924 RepID=UPI002572AC1F|nr:AMP-binding protein [Gordonia sp. ABSL11-1]MDL9948622.1 AMP-binding protein [Gordonia sp. ABSL11-1]